MRESHELHVHTSTAPTQPHSPPALAWTPELVPTLGKREWVVPAWARRLLPLPAKLSEWAHGMTWHVSRCQRKV